MLNKIRKTANNFLFRTLLALIVVSFIAFGSKSFIQDKDDFDIVTFDKAENIRYKDFIKIRNQVINEIQKDNDLQFTEEELRKSPINNEILQKIVNNAIVDYIASYYNLTLSDPQIVSFIKNSNIFQNDNNDFDTEVFYNFINKTAQTEQEYLHNFTKNILRSTISKIFTSGFVVPEIMVHNILNYEAMQKKVDIFSINLDNDIAIKGYNPSTEELKKLYAENQNMFTTEETRDLSYIILSENLVKKSINITEQEISLFLSENSADFTNQPIEQAKKQISQILLDRKFEEISAELSKSLEDDVASGTTLEEIASKYDVKVKKIHNLTYQDLKKNKTIFDSSLADSIFDMVELELSYPMYNKKEIALVFVDKVTQSELQNFEQVSSAVRELGLKNYVKEQNLLNFKALSKQYLDKVAGDSKLDKNITLTTDILLKKNAPEHKLIPSELQDVIFKTKKGTITNIIISGNKAYFAYVKSINIKDIKKQNTLKTDAYENLVNNINYCIFEELLQYFNKQNNTKVHYHR